VSLNERALRRGLILIALGGLAAGAAAYLGGRAAFASALWTVGTIPVAVALAVSMTRDLLAGRMGVDAVALISMTAALGGPSVGKVNLPKGRARERLAKTG